jgi:hypothetical protein
MPPKSSSAGASGSAKASAGGGSGGATRSAKANAGGGGASDDAASGTKPRKGGSLRGVKNWVFRSTKSGSKAGKGAASSAARTSRQTFQDLDVDGSGFLSIDELKGLLASPGGGHALSDADIAEIVAEFGA